VRLACLLVVLTATTSARAEQADDVADVARAHFSTGLEYYDRKAFGEAVREFATAFKLSPRPELLYNMGRAYEHVPDAGRAYHYYRRYLIARPDAAEREAVLDTLERLRPQVANLVVHAPADASVLVDDQPVEDPVDPIWVTAGTHRVVARRAGSIDDTANVVLPALQAKAIRLEPLTPAAMEQRRRDRSHRRWRWAGPLLGVSLAVVAGVAVGLGVGLGSRDYASQGRAACTGGCVVVEQGKGP
jgi:tetratricopeptide (TPR) repeat protein